MALSDRIKTVAYCEINNYCQAILLSRMAEGSIDSTPIWDDITTLDGTQFKAYVDIIFGGSPCQGFSVAGLRKGLADERSSLISHVFRLLDETEAPILFLENVPNIRSIGAESICKELAKRGYDSRWCCVSASDVGAPHKRERWFLLAYAEHSGSPQPEIRRGSEKGIRDYKERENGSLQFEGMDYSRDVASKCATNSRKEARNRFERSDELLGSKSYWKKTQSPFCGVDVRLPFDVDAIRALGNSVCPQAVKKAFEILTGKTP